MTTSESRPIRSEIATIIGRAMGAGSVAQRDILVERFLDGYEYGWWLADNVTCGASHSKIGACRAARRAATRAHRQYPPSWDVVAMEQAVDESDDIPDGYRPIVIVPAPGHYGDTTGVLATCNNVEEARKLLRKYDTSVARRAPGFRTGSRWLRVYDESSPIVARPE